MAGTGLKNGVFSDEDWRAYQNAWSQPGALTGALNYYRALRPADESADHRVHVPTLVLWGEARSCTYHPQSGRSRCVCAGLDREAVSRGIALAGS